MMNRWGCTTLWPSRSRWGVTCNLTQASKAKHVYMQQWDFFDSYNGKQFVQYFNMFFGRMSSGVIRVSKSILIRVSNCVLIAPVPPPPILELEPFKNHGGRLLVRAGTNPPPTPLDPPTHTSWYLVRTANPELLHGPCAGHFCAPLLGTPENAGVT